MAVWGGRYKFEDVSVSRQDYTLPATRGGYSRPQDRVSSASAATQAFWRPPQTLRPKDHFTSPQPLPLGSHQARPCPLGCPCNQSERTIPLESAEHLHDNNSRWTPLESHPYSSSYFRPSNDNPQQHCPPLHRPMSQFSSRPSPHLTGHPIMSRQYSQPGRTPSIPPRHGIPVGWGRVDLNTVYNEQYSDYWVQTSRQAQVPSQQSRPETPPRWETSYSSFCKNLLHVTRAF